MWYIVKAKFVISFSTLTTITLDSLTCDLWR